MPDAATGIGGAMSVGQMAMGGDSASGAAATQSASADQAIALQKQMYDQARSDLAPWRTAGTSSINQLAYLLGLPGYNPGNATSGYNLASLTGGNGISSYVDSNGDPLGRGDNTNIVSGTLRPDQIDYDKIRRERSDVVADRGNSESALYDWYVKHGAEEEGAGYFGKEGATQAPQDLVNSDQGEYGSLMKDFTLDDFEKEPGYEFRLGEGQKALDRAASARGGFVSGRALKEASRYGQDFASNEFGKAYDRFNNNRSMKYNMLTGVSNSGQGAVNSGIQAGSNYANSVSDLYTQQGNVNAAGQVGSSNSWSTGLGDIAGSVSGLFGSSNTGNGGPFGSINWNGPRVG